MALRSMKNLGRQWTSLFSWSCWSAIEHTRSDQSVSPTRDIRCLVPKLTCYSFYRFWMVGGMREPCPVMNRILDLLRDNQMLWSLRHWASGPQEYIDYYRIITTIYPLKIFYPIFTFAHVWDIWCKNNLTWFNGIKWEHPKLNICFILT